MNIFFVSVIGFIAAMILIIIIGTAGAVAETSAEKDERLMQGALNRETRVLNDGRIVVIEKSSQPGYQMTGFSSKTYREKAEIGAHSILVIDKIKAVNADENKLICIASGTKRYVDYAYDTDYADDLYSYLYHYKQKQVTSEAICWLSALNGFSDLKNELKPYM